MAIDIKRMDRFDAPRPRPEQARRPGRPAMPSIARTSTPRPPLVGTLRQRRAARKREAQGRDGLTERQTYVLRRIDEGAQSPAIGAELGIAPATVRAHARDARRKLAGS
jgi:DNA-binding NarL/FixJ family response regulator